MLQLDAVVVEQRVEESTGGHREAALVEGNEGHHVAVRRRGLIRVTGELLLHRGGPITDDSFRWEVTSNPCHGSYKGAMSSGS